MADSIRSYDDILRQIQNLQVRQGGASGQAQQSGAAGAPQTGAGTPVTEPDQAQNQEKIKDATRFTDEVKEIKGNKSGEMYTPAVLSLMEQLQNLISTGMDNPQKDGAGARDGSSSPEKKDGQSSQGSQSSGSRQSQDVDSQFRELFGMPPRAQQEMAEAKDRMSREDFEKDPEAVLKKGGSSEGSKAESAGPKELTFNPSTSNQGLFKTSRKESDMVRQDEALGTIETKGDGSVRDAFISALEKMVSKSMGIPVTIDDEGKVITKSPVKVHSITSGEQVEQGNTPMTVDAMSGMKPFEEFMKDQPGDEFTKAKEYLAKNSEAPDADWVKKRVSGLEKQRDGQIPHNRELMSEYQSLWSDGKRLNL
jgi:hypothetical protein